jgi:hypothetical protein
MRMLRRRPPTLLERVVGKKRARRARRRLGYLALGTGVAMLKPTMRRVAIMTGGVAVFILFLVH